VSEVAAHNVDSPSRELEIRVVIVPTEEAVADPTEVIAQEITTGTIDLATLARNNG
jgi:hypothetical protein